MTRTETLQARWAELAPRERQMVVVAVTLVVLALLWWVALAPALRTLAAARDEHARLDAQLQQMSTLQAQRACSVSVRVIVPPPPASAAGRLRCARCSRAAPAPWPSH
ncbi:MAG: hypothetical protein EOO24_27875 [Comamonadaceae bacterium]|nr:MAG: hypothetical protein EOO24_27875 [Comamonadaceae bacterium]